MATLKIYGDIGEPDPMAILFIGEADSTVSAKTVSDFLDEHKNDSEHTIKINSRGGDVQEGFAIYDLLRNSGKKITTIGEGKVYSIATVILLAGDKGSRKMTKNSDGLIHNPYIPPYTLADAYESDDLIKIAESLKEEEAKILDFYVQHTGAEESRLAELMKEDTKLGAEDMLELGFIDEILEPEPATKNMKPIKAYAYFKPNIYNNMKDQNEFNKAVDRLKEAGAKLFGRLPSKDQELTDKDGKVFKLDKEEGAPAVGDTASPDGVYTMESGEVITVKDGVIESIETPDGTEEMQAKIDDLQSQLDQMKADKEASEAKVTDLEGQLTEAKKVETEFQAKKVEADNLIGELSKLKNEWKPATRNNVKKSDDKVSIDIEKVQAAREKLKS